MKHGRARVVYWNNIPSPYMVERFDALARRNNITLEVWFSRQTSPERSWQLDEREWSFSFKYLPSVGVGPWRIALPIGLLRRGHPDLLVSLYAEPSFVIGWFLARFRRIQTAFWTEVTFETWVPRVAWKERLKRYMFRRVGGVITVGPDGRKFAARYGADPERTFTARHSIDIQHFSQGAAEARVGRERLRMELGLVGTTFIYVGRLWWGKGLSHLLEAFAELQRRHSDEVSLLLVGDGPDSDQLRLRCAADGIRNVVFAGFQQREQLPSYLAASDVFVFPTLGDPYGLVIDEAMASGLPIISTRAAGEISERIEEGVNGFIVEPADSTALLECMNLLALDPSARARMGSASERMIAGHTPDRWASDFERAVAGILRDGSPK